MILKDIIQWYDTTGFEMIQCYFLVDFSVDKGNNRA